MSQPKQPEVTISYARVTRAVSFQLCRDCGGKWSDAGVQGQHGAHLGAGKTPRLLNCVGAVIGGGG